DLAGGECDIDLVGCHAADRLVVEVRSGFVGHRACPHLHDRRSRLPRHGDPRVVDYGNTVRERGGGYNQKTDRTPVGWTGEPAARTSHPARIATYSTPILMTSPVSIAWASASSYRPLSASRFLAIWAQRSSSARSLASLPNGFSISTPISS